MDVMDRSRSRPRRALHNSAHDDFFGMPSVPNSTPTIGRLRRVLIIIDFSEIRHVAEELCQSDSLQVTRCSHLCPNWNGENSSFYVFQAHPCIQKLLRVTPGENSSPMLVTKSRSLLGCSDRP